MQKRIAILALQGAFAEHRQMLHSIGADAFFVRQKADWQQAKDGLILPGGESTTMMKLLRDLDLFEAIKSDIEHGLPVFGTCAGMILLSEDRLATMDIQVKRNAYGRQLGSFHTTGDVEGVGQDVPMTFIRAPYITDVMSPDCKVLARVDGNIVAAQQGKQLATSFHPELDSDTRLHEYFLSF